jgi:hypothetical protein
MPDGGLYQALPGGLRTSNAYSAVELRTEGGIEPAEELVGE